MIALSIFVIESFVPLVFSPSATVQFHLASYLLNPLSASPFRRHLLFPPSIQTLRSRQLDVMCIVTTLSHPSPQPSTLPLSLSSFGNDLLLLASLQATIEVTSTLKVKFTLTCWPLPSPRRSSAIQIIDLINSFVPQYLEPTLNAGPCRSHIDSQTSENTHTISSCSTTHVLRTRTLQSTSHLHGHELYRASRHFRGWEMDPTPATRALIFDPLISSSDPLKSVIAQLQGEGVAVRIRGDKRHQYSAVHCQKHRY